MIPCYNNDSDILIIITTIVIIIIIIPKPGTVFDTVVIIKATVNWRFYPQNKTLSCDSRLIICGETVTNDAGAS